MSKKSTVARWLHRVGVFRLLDLVTGPNRLTVLAYHRIVDPADVGDYYLPNISASPAMFARQIEFVARRFNVVGLDQILAYIKHGQPLLPRPLLITFDDGYLDNYTQAFPILKHHGLPAVIFLMTDGMDHQARPWWDACAYYFHHTSLKRATLPVLGEQVFITAQQRIEAREEFMRRLKRLPEAEKQATMAALPEALQVPPPEDPQVFMSWEQVRELVANGIACQPHTATHPILTRISPEEVRNELRTARDKIVAETAQPVEAFAFPNGTPDDYDETSLQILHELGFQAAFTLSPGPVRNRLVQQYPLQIPRVFLGYKDTFELFVAKVMGVPALMDRPAYLPLPVASNDV